MTWRVETRTGRAERWKLFDRFVSRELARQASKFTRAGGYDTRVRREPKK